LNWLLTWLDILSLKFCISLWKTFLHFHVVCLSWESCICCLLCIYSLHVFEYLRSLLTHISMKRLMNFGVMRIPWHLDMSGVLVSFLPRSSVFFTWVKGVKAAHAVLSLFCSSNPMRSGHISLLVFLEECIRNVWSRTGWNWNRFVSGMWVETNPQKLNHEAWLVWSTMAYRGVNTKFFGKILFTTINCPSRFFSPYASFILYLRCLLE